MPLTTLQVVRCDVGTADACTGVAHRLEQSTRAAATKWLIEAGWRPRPHGEWTCPHCAKPRVASVPAGALTSRTLRASDYVKPNGGFEDEPEWPNPRTFDPEKP